MNTYFIVVTDVNGWQGHHKVRVKGGSFNALTKLMTGTVRIVPAGTDVIRVYESEAMHLEGKPALVEVRLPLHAMTRDNQKTA